MWRRTKVKGGVGICLPFHSIKGLQQKTLACFKREVWLGTRDWCFDHFLNPTTLALSDLYFLTHQQIKNLVIQCTCKDMLCSKLSCFQYSNNNNPFPHSWPWIRSWDKQLSAQCSPLEAIKISRVSLTMTSHPFKGKVWGISHSQVTQFIVRLSSEGLISTRERDVKLWYEDIRG